MRIAVCDDDRQELLRMLSWLSSYQEQRIGELYCQSFENATDLLASMEREEYDLVFLDVLMPGVTGMEAAHEIREKDEHVRIIFLTSSPEFAVESYRVQAFDYFLKPVTRERTFSILDKLSDALKEPEDSLTIRNSGSIFRLPYRRIEYIEVMAKTLYFHLSDGTVRRVYASMSEYETALLAHLGFCKVHRSYLVNFRWVTEVNAKELLTSSGCRIPIARAASQQVRTEYTEFLFAAADMDVKQGGRL